MPRHVVTLSPRLLVLPTPRNRAARENIEGALAERYRTRRGKNRKSIAIDFPKSAPRRAAKDEVASELDSIEPGWRRLYILYPTDSSLREHGE